MRFFLGLLALLSTTLVTNPAHAADVTIEEAWALPSKGPNGAAFMTIHNNSASTVKITAAKGSISKTIEMHEHEEGANGVMRMRPVSALTIPAGQTLILAPGHTHLMLMGITAPLSVDKTFPLTLVLEDGKKLETKVAVRTAE